MLAAYAARFATDASPDTLLDGLEVGERPEPEAREHWATVDVRAASVPRIIGSCSARSPTAWLTAYRMLFTSGRATPGQRVLVQGAGGGVSTAAVLLGAAAGLEMFVTSRDEAKRDRALDLGAAAVVEPGGRLPAKVDVVLETVGAATWSHSVRSVRPGGTIVVAGATSGDASPAELQHIFFLEISVVGATMGSKDDLERLLALMGRTGLRPLVDATFHLARARAGLARLARGSQFGKIVLEV